MNELLVIGDWLLEKRKTKSGQRKAESVRSFASLRMTLPVILRPGGPKNLETLRYTQSDKFKIPLFLRFFASLRMTRRSVDGKRLKNGLLVVILRSLPQVDDEESRRS